MADWSSAQYLQFAGERTRPAADLLARIGCERPRAVADIGCGPGNSTELLTARWPKARIAGIDTSPDMLKAARERLPDATFEQVSAEDWKPGPEDDVLFANASLHWTADPVATIRRLHEAQPHDGWIAVQMPDNVNEPSHRLMEEAAAAKPFADKVAGTARDPLAAPTAFFDALSGISDHIDLWHTSYYHRMDDVDAIVEWVRSTGLKPYLDKLSADEAEAFVADYRSRLEMAYPAMANGERLLRYPRFFVVARRA
ncbi:trans-aconitate 2-methyltransferase [Notoacmeibacter sp. MSK16QG-6]|uniref:trans-aconitate 2-methyltransferase n=1 Tax=Notoacmeibacter sp. MSK16QG-6 TaxID=2957982 RepID=UPI00209E6684|nr:trans-aconitate 2-methyltransferase [Notoacmeibacter sp. MSK16QG-6]MCP1199730.1 trans-aconitate 2-methyltransferase [Notoacmeibacter sp. MSK16QG-6]